MSKQGPSFQFYPTDIAPDLDPLTMEERGMYMTLMRYLWTVGPMPIDEAEALIGKAWVSCGAIFRRKFIETDSTLSLEWMEEQREKQATFRRIQSENGGKGGRPRKEKKGSLSNGKPKANPKESPRVGVGIGVGIGNGVGKEDALKVELYPTFQNFWEAYERKGNRKTAEAEWQRIAQVEREAIMQNIPAYNASKPDKQYRKDGERYLKHRVWEDAIVIPTTTATPTNNGQRTAEQRSAEYARILAERYPTE